MTEHDHELALAQHYLEIDQPRQALSALDGIREQAVEDPDFWRIQAAARHDAEEYRSASEAAGHGLDLEPQSTALLAILASAETQLDQLRDAERAALAALQVSPDEPELLFVYARVVARGRQLDKARKLVERAAGIDPEHPEVPRMRAYLAYLSGDDRAAARHAEEILTDEPEDPSAHQLRGAALAQTGRYARANESFRTAVREDPTNRDAAAAARELGALSHPLLWPLLPIQRLGVAGSWVAAMAIIFGLRGLGLTTPALIATVVWIALVAYSWLGAPIALKWLESRAL